MRVTVSSVILAIFALALSFALDGWLRLAVSAPASALAAFALMLIVLRPLVRFVRLERKSARGRVAFFFANWAFLAMFATGAFLELQALGGSNSEPFKMTVARSIPMACCVALIVLLNNGRGDHKRDLRELFTREGHG